MPTIHGILTVAILAQGACLCMEERHTILLGSTVGNVGGRAAYGDVGTPRALPVWQAVLSIWSMF